MLTHEDLQAIGQLIDDKVPALVQPIVKAEIDGLEERVNVKLDAVQEQLDAIENKALTMNGLERSLMNFEARLTEKFDRRYARR